MPNQADLTSNQADLTSIEAESKLAQVDSNEGSGVVTRRGLSSEGESGMGSQLDSGKKKKKKGKSEAEEAFVSQVFPDASDVWQELFRQAAKEFRDD